MGGPDLVVLCPLLQRADRFPTMLASLRDTAPQVSVLFLVTPGDRVVHAAVAAQGAPMVTVPYQPVGDYARKINTGLVATEAPLLFLGADDLLFHPGWLEAIYDTLAEHPDVGVIGTQDLGQPRCLAGQHSTHSIVTRHYALTRGTIDQPGLILHEGYVHEYCDDELVETAKARGAWAFADTAVVEHLHPNWGKANLDPLYLNQQRRMRTSRPLFQRRRALWT